MKSAFIRVDLNIPINSIEHPKISTLKKIITFYKKIFDTVILCSHLGQPAGYDIKLSFAALLENLILKTGEKISLLKELKRPQKSGVYLLENIRFDKREYTNCPSLSLELAQMADLCFFEALACSHRPHASIYQLARHEKTQLGHFAKIEIKHWQKIRDVNKSLYMIGGVKASTKIPLIKHIIKNTEVFIFGAIAHCFLRQSRNLGQSHIPALSQNFVNQIQEEKNIHLPTDFLWLDPIQNKTYIDVNPQNNTDIIVDIGPRSVSDLTALMQGYEQIIWLGPSCWFEKIKCRSSVQDITDHLLFEKKPFIVAGGETAQALLSNYDQGKIAKYLIDAGGAFMTYLSDQELSIPKSWYCALLQPLA